MQPKSGLRLLLLLMISMVFIAPLIWSSYFHQQHVYVKGCFAAFAFTFASLGLIFEKNLRLPPRPLMIATGVLLFFKVVAVGLHFNPVSLVNLVETLSFAVTVLYFASAWNNHNFTIRNLFWFYLISGLAVSAFAIRQFIHSRIINGIEEPVFYSGTFGNINMMAEYLIFLLPLGFLLLKSEKGWRSHFLQLTSVAWVFLLLAGRGRSAWIGLALCLGYSLLKGITRKELVTYALGFLLYTCTWWVPYVGSDYQEAKTGSFKKRMMLYESSLEMLGDHPLGIGPGNFVYSYLPYQLATLEKPVETEMVSYPHSEFLKWGIENGWAFLFFNFFWWLTLTIAVWKIPGTKEQQIFYRTSLLVVGPQVLFQFPFENPASALALTFIFGLTLAAARSPDFEIRKPFKILFLGLAVVFLYRASTLTLGRWSESLERQQMETLQLACELDPSNWRICFFYSMRAIDSSYPEDGRRNIENQLRNRPFDFHALRALGYYYIRSQKFQPACEVVQVYDSILAGQRGFSEEVTKQCKVVPHPFPFKTSRQFEQDYLKWISKYL